MHCEDQSDATDYFSDHHLSFSALYQRIGLLPIQTNGGAGEQYVFDRVVCKTRASRIVYVSVAHVMAKAVAGANLEKLVKLPICIGAVGANVAIGGLYGRGGLCVMETRRVQHFDIFESRLASGNNGAQFRIRDVVPGHGTGHLLEHSGVVTPESAFENDHAVQIAFYGLCI
jgi:hypothetical protein